MIKICWEIQKERSMLSPGPSELHEAGWPGPLYEASGPCYHAQRTGVGLTLS